VRGGVSRREGGVVEMEEGGGRMRGRGRMIAVERVVGR